MYLLKRAKISIKARFVFYSNSTMYLLKLIKHAEGDWLKINSHSTMYLLKPPQLLGCGVSKGIHIPPCIY